MLPSEICSFCKAVCSGLGRALLVRAEGSAPSAVLSLSRGLCSWKCSRILTWPSAQRSAQLCLSQGSGGQDTGPSLETILELRKPQPQPYIWNMTVDIWSSWPPSRVWILAIVSWLCFSPGVWVPCRNVWSFNPAGLGGVRANLDCQLDCTCSYLESTLLDVSVSAFP